jgi:hypothetical protein
MQRTSSDLMESSLLTNKRELTHTSSVNLTGSRYEPAASSSLTRHGSSSSLYGSAATARATTPVKSPVPSFTRSVSASFGNLTRSMSNSSFSASDFNARSRQVRCKVF